MENEKTDKARELIFKTPDRGVLTEQGNHSHPNSGAGPGVPAGPTDESRQETQRAHRQQRLRFPHGPIHNLFTAFSTSVLPSPQPTPVCLPNPVLLPHVLNKAHTNIGNTSDAFVWTTPSVQIDCSPHSALRSTWKDDASYAKPVGQRSQSGSALNINDDVDGGVKRPRNETTGPEEPQAKSRRLNYKKCTFCRKDKKPVRAPVMGELRMRHLS